MGRRNQMGGAERGAGTEGAGRDPTGRDATETGKHTGARGGGGAQARVASGAGLAEGGRPGPGARPRPFPRPLPASYQRLAGGRPWARGGGGGALLQVRWRRRVCGGRCVAGRAGGGGRHGASGGAGARGRGLVLARRALSIRAWRPSAGQPGAAPATCPPAREAGHLPPPPGPPPLPGPPPACDPPPGGSAGGSRPHQDAA